MRYPLSVFLLLWTSFGFSQEVSVSNPNTNYLYVGISNPLQGVVENLSCGEFYLTTENGEIEGDSCLFHIRPDTVGRATVLFNKIEEGDTLFAFAKQDLSVREWPDPRATVGRSAGGEIEKYILEVQPGIIVEMVNIGVCLDLDVYSFSTLIIRDNEIIFKDDQEGKRFDSPLTEKLKNIEEGDEVIFYNLLVKMPAGEPKTLQPLHFLVN